MTEQDIVHVDDDFENAKTKEDFQEMIQQAYEDKKMYFWPSVAMAESAVEFLNVTDWPEDLEHITFTERCKIFQMIHEYFQKKAEKLLNMPIGDLYNEIKKDNSISKGD